MSAVRCCEWCGCAVDGRKRHCKNACRVAKHRGQAPRVACAACETSLKPGRDQK